MKVIGIMGRKRVGKDTLASAIRVNHPCCATLRFAQPLYEICKVLLGGDGTPLGDFEKDQPHPKVQDYGFATGRQMMEFIGTDLFRARWRPDVWVLAAEKRLYAQSEAGFGLSVSPDVRFPQEAQLIKKWGGKLIGLRLKDDHRPILHESDDPPLGMCDEVWEFAQGDIEGIRRLGERIAKEMT